MPSTERIQRLHKIIWVLIYVGLLGVIIGVVIRAPAPIAGYLLIAAGLLSVAAGAVLIYLRSRMHEEQGAP